MIFIKGKMKKRASNQSKASLIENSLSKSALDRSSRSILDEYQKKFEDNQKVLQGYIDLLKELNQSLSKIGDNVEKQYKWLKDKPELIPSTPGGQEQLDDIEEKLCQTMGDDGNGNPGCNVTLEQLCDLTCDKTDENSSCITACEASCQTSCETQTQGVSCPSYCDTNCQENCERQGQDQCQGTTEGTCNLLADKCPTLEDVLRECGQCLGVCVGPGENCSELCDAIGDASCTEYGQDGWCGLLESTCGTLGDKLDCVSLGDYSGNTCYDVGETNCSASGEKYCTQVGEQYCYSPSEKICYFPGEASCLFEGEDEGPNCNMPVDKYMCDNSADGPDACYDVGEANCKYSGEKYCREPGEKFFCFFYEDNACTSIADQTIYCKYYDDDSIPWCEQAVVDACNIPFKDCLNSAECPAEFGSAAGCDTQGCPATCNDFCIDTCDTNCFHGCNKSCLTTCVSTCDSSCFNGCDKSCLASCVSTCDTSCFKGCDKNCEKTCITTCDTTCFGVCINTCDKTCFGTCITTCDSSCFSGCDKSCTSYCDTGCEQTCDSSCYKGCDKSCTSYCDAGCDSSCYKGCDNECTGYSCNKTCDMNFQCTGCDGTAPCMAACIPSSQTCPECHGGGRWCTVPVGGV